MTTSIPTGLSHDRIAYRAIAAGLTLALAASLTGCGAGGSVSSNAVADTEANAVVTTSGTAEIHYLDTADMFTERDTDASYDVTTATTITLSGDSASVNGSGVTTSEDTLIITDEGTYVLSGTLTNGQVVVDVTDDAKVQLVLDDAHITSSTGTALYVRNADKVFVTLADDTDNSIASTGAAETVDERNLDGAVYSHDTLTVNGQGNLAVTSAQAHGIVVKDDLKLCVGGAVDVHAAKSALQAKESVRATGEGTYTLVAGTDGVHVEYTDDDADTAAQGYIYIAGGNFDVTADSDGFDASYILQVDGGTITVAADDDGLHAEADLVVRGGTIDVSECYEGLEGARVGIDGGDITVVASDDGINATGDDNRNTTGDVTFGEDPSDVEAMGDAGGAPTMGDGSAPELSAKGGAAAADAGGEPPALPDGSDGEMPANGMGMPLDNGEGRPTPPDGGMGGGPHGNGGRGRAGTDAMSIETDTSTDADTSGTADRGSFGGRNMMGGNGGNMMDADDSALIRITDGTLHVDAGGDGIDSNGEIVMSGGTVQVDGPVNTGNGALDCGSGITISGGTLLATSAGGMEENATSGTTQPTFLVSLGANVTGTVTVTAQDGTEVASWASDKQFNAVIMSSPDLVVGESYTVAAGDVSVTVELDDVVTGEGAGMAFGGMGGGMRGQGQPMAGRIDGDMETLASTDDSDAVVA